MPTRQTITLKEAGELLQMNRETVRLLIHEGKIEAFKLTEGETSPFKIYRDSVIEYARRVQKRSIK